MTSIFSLSEWFDITEENGTYGDQVKDILESWKDDRDDLVAQREFWKKMAKEGEAEINELSRKNSLLSLKNKKLRELLDDTETLVLKHNQLFWADNVYPDWSNLQMKIRKLLQETEA